MASPKETLEIGGREVTISNPQKVYFPDAGYTKLDLVRYYLAVADGALTGIRGRPMALKRFVDGITKEPFFQKRAPDNTPDWIRTAELTFPSGRTADEIVVDEAGGAHLDRQPRLHRPQPAPGPGRRPRPSRRAAHRPRSGARRRVAADPRRGAGLSRGARGGRAGRLAEDVRLARHPHQRPHRAALDVSRRSAVRRWRWRATSSARAPDAGDVQVVEGGAPRRLPRLQPERQGPDGRVGLLGPAAARRARLDAAVAGTRSPTVEAEAFTIATVPQRFAEIGDPGAGIDDAVGSLEALLELSARARARGRGRRPVAAELREAGRRAAARPAVAQARAPDVRVRAGPRRGRRPAARGRRGARGRGRRRRPERRPADRVGRLAPDAHRPAQDQRPGHRDLAGRLEGGGARGSRALEGAPPEAVGGTSSRPTCSSTACAAAHRSGTGSGST